MLSWTNYLTREVIMSGVTAQDGTLDSGPRIKLDSNFQIGNQAPAMVTLNDITFIGPDSGYYKRIYDTRSTSNGANNMHCQISNCTFSGFPQNDVHNPYSIETGSNFLGGDEIHTFEVINCIFSDCDSIVDSGQYNGAGKNAVSGSIINCTLYESSLHATISHDESIISWNVTNCLFQGGSGRTGYTDSLIFSRWNDNTGTHSFSSIDNIISDASATHASACTFISNLQDSVTFNDSGSPSTGQVSFTSATAEDFSLVDDANNIALGNSAATSTPDTDILGVTRDTNRDAGAFEVIAASDISIQLPRPIIKLY